MNEAIFMDLNLILSVFSVLLGTVLGASSVYFYKRVKNEANKRELKQQAKRILNRAHVQVSEVQNKSKKQLKEFETRTKKTIEKELFRARQKMKQEQEQWKEKERRLEKELQKKEEKWMQKQERLSQKEEHLKLVELKTQEMEKRCEAELDRLQTQLETVSSMSKEKAKEELKSSVKTVALKEAQEESLKIEEEIKSKAQKKAKEIISVALARYAGEVATEKTVSTLSLPNDELKGKIIGREGRNIRALEASCGVDVIVDETPESVLISCFDPVRREIARLTILRLIEDGRVHPARIEEVTDQVKKVLFQKMKEDGEKACFDLGLHSVHPALLQLIGQLKYRQIESQNLYSYSLEVAHLAGLLAQEISYDVKEAHRAGLFHAIGQVIDHKVEGSHAKVGAENLKKYGEKDSIIHAVRAYNGEVPGEHILAHILRAATQMALVRPGVKNSMTQKFIRRLENLESIANSFDGVLRTFAIQAGKEIHVLVDSAKITDDQSFMLSRDIAQKIERELNYPGQIKITVIRETRVIEHAR